MSSVIEKYKILKFSAYGVILNALIIDILSGAAPIGDK